MQQQISQLRMQMGNWKTDLIVCNRILYNEIYKVHLLPGTSVVNGLVRRCDAIVAYNIGNYLLGPSSSTPLPVGVLGCDFRLIVREGSFIAGDGSSWTVRIAACCSVASV